MNVTEGSEIRPTIVSQVHELMFYKIIISFWQFHNSIDDVTAYL